MTASTSKPNSVDPSLGEFLENMVAEIVREHGNEIVSISLFGSAATGEWVKGKSDIDFIVVTQNQNARKAVENSVNRILLDLDKKHNLHLAQTCSVFVKRDDPIVNFFYRVESLLMFGKPFYVFSLDQIAFDKGTIADSRIRFVTMIFDPLSIFLAKMKQTGVTIYGKNLIAEIQFSTSAVDKIRVAMAPLWLVIMSLISFPVDELFALRHSTKATIWACEDMLFALGFPLSTATREAQQVEDIFRDRKVNLDHLKKTIELKNRLISKTDISKGFVAKYILSTIAFILTLYYSTSRLSRVRRQNSSPTFSSCF